MIPEAMVRDVRTLFLGDASGHDWYHTERVMRMAERLARAEGADEEICLLAALLHDADDYKLTGGEPGSTVRAEALMAKYSVPARTRERVCAIIRAVSFKGKDSVRPETPEGMVVQDADRLDAIGAIGVARTFAYGGSRGRPMHDPGEVPSTDMSAEEYARHQGSSVNHFYEKLLLLRDMMNTKSAREIAAARHRVMEAFLEEFFAEWDGLR